MKMNVLKIGLFGLAAALAAWNAGGSGAFAASETVSEAQQRKEQLADSLKEAGKLIDKLKESKGDIEQAVTELDKKLTDISGQITELEEQVQKKSKEIKKTRKELKAAKALEKEQYENMKTRIRYMYENSGMSYLEALISSDSFADFISQAEYISRILEYDRNMLDEYQETCRLIAHSDETLKNDRAELQEMQEQLDDERKAVDLLLAEKESQLSDVSSKLGDAQDEAARYEAEIAAENQIIQEILAAERRAKEEEEARKAAQEQKEMEDSDEPDTSENDGVSDSSSSNVNTDNSYTGGQFTWPCPSSNRITSSFGYRDQPTAGATTYHQGIDIGAAYGAAIVAAADGVVTSTGYSNVLGNYVILSHGGGLFTVYFHCSSVLVVSGQNVSRGSTIAKVGSTGVSTGNHLHFGVQLNGKYVNPMNYL